MKKIIWLLSACFIITQAKQVVAIISVDGMTCPLCTMTIKKNLKKQNGVLKAKVLLSSKKAFVTYDDQKTDKARLLKAIDEVGYKGKVDEIKEDK